jgi:hypothetical protein
LIHALDHWLHSIIVADDEVELTAQFRFSSEQAAQVTEQME